MMIRSYLSITIPGAGQLFSLYLQVRRQSDSLIIAITIIYIHTVTMHGDTSHPSLLSTRLYFLSEHDSEIPLLFIIHICVLLKICLSNASVRFNDTIVTATILAGRIPIRSHLLLECLEIHH